MQQGGRSKAETKVEIWCHFLSHVLMPALVLASAIAVIYVSHINRRAFGEYQLLINTRDKLETEWGQLLLEESALASYARIERIATKSLGMRVPKTAEIIMVHQ